MKIKFENNHPNYNLIKYSTDGNRLRQEYNKVQSYKKESQNTLNENNFCSVKVNNQNNIYTYQFVLEQKMIEIQQWVKKRQQNLITWEQKILNLIPSLIQTLKFSLENISKPISIKHSNILIASQSNSFLVFPFSFKQEEQNQKTPIQNLFICIDYLLHGSLFQDYENYYVRGIWQEQLSQLLNGVLKHNWELQVVQKYEIPKKNNLIVLCPLHNLPLQKHNIQTKSLLCKNCLQQLFYDLQIQKIRVSQQLEQVIQKWVKIDAIYQDIQKRKLQIKYVQPKEIYRQTQNKIEQLRKQVDGEIISICKSYQKLQNYQQELVLVKQKANQKHQQIINQMNMKIKKFIIDEYLRIKLK